MPRQWYVEGVQIQEEGSEEVLVESFQINEDQPTAVATNDGAAAYHYLQQQGAY